MNATPSTLTALAERLELWPLDRLRPYLEGQDGVFIESRTGFDVDGVEIKARLDFGAKAIDWRGLFKNPGIALT